MIQNVKTGGGDSRSRSTIPAPALLGPSSEVERYLRAQEAVRVALAEQARCLAALRELDSRFPVGVSL